MQKYETVDITSSWAKCYSLACPIDQLPDILSLDFVWEIPGKSQDFRVQTLLCAIESQLFFPLDGSK